MRMTVCGRGRRAGGSMGRGARIPASRAGAIVRLGVAVGFLVVSGAASPAHAAAATAARSFEFPSLNRTYRMDGATVAPIQQGPITIHLSSPRNALVVQHHVLELEPLGDGTYRSRVTVDLLGSGDLIARFDTGSGSGSPMEDRVVLPRQAIDLEGRVRFQRVPAGWEVTALELPEETSVTIQSHVINSLVTACEQLAAFLGLDCGGLESSLTRVAVPLPPPGSVFLLEASDLTPEEVRGLDEYLGF